MSELIRKSWEPPEVPTVTTNSTADALSTAREEGFRAGRLAGIEEVAKLYDCNGVCGGGPEDCASPRCFARSAAAIRALKEKQP